MKLKHLSLAVAALVAAGGLWFAGSAWRTPQKSSMGVRVKNQHGQAQPRQMLRPPDPTRKFWELTPEQRVKQARQPEGIGG